MGLNLDYFYSLTPREFENIAKGYNDKQTRLLEAANHELKASWERARIIAHQVYCSIPQKKGKKHVGVAEFLPFEWDKKEESEDKKPVKAMTKKEVKNLFESWDKIEFKENKK